MPEPEDRDVDWDGNPARLAWEAAKKTGQQWAGGGSVDQVREVMLSTGYPDQKMTFVSGMVDDYGYYKGAREATDEYIQQNHLKLLLTRVNMSVHQAVKIEA